MNRTHCQTGVTFTYSRKNGVYTVAYVSADGTRSGSTTAPLDSDQAARAGYLFEQETIANERVRLGL